MWDHAATQANVSTLTERGVHVIPPASGRLTGADTGPGRLPEPDELYAVCQRILAHGAAAAAAPSRPVPLQGYRVVVTAGGTREPLDPVRFLGNRSSGKQGYALAAVAVKRGATVTLIAANTAIPAPVGVRLVTVQTALELQEAVEKATPEADVVVMAAAVADFRPAHYTDAKIKKSHDPAHPDAAPTIELVRNPDILAELVRTRAEASSPVIVGFAAETGDTVASVLDHGRDKLARKGCDLLVVNEVGADKTFGADDNTVHILRRGSSDVVEVGPASKDDVAAAVWDAVQEIL
jgi:phosphopantothenoylcysteine decarboxylase / phosphopantothenate---cysteine ligase